MRILVTGAQFHNKGAQALLFSIMDVFRKRYKEVEIYYMPLDDVRAYPSNVYKFKLVYGRWDAHLYENAPIKRPYVIAIAIMRKLLRKNAVSISDVVKLHKILPTLDAIIDVSGFQLTSKFENKYNNQFLDYIDEASRYQKPIILMPQSFGPFDYKLDREKMLDRIKKTLPKASLIFAREKEGYDLLKNEIHLNNVELSPDLVLQTDEPDVRNIYETPLKLQFRRLHTKNNIGIIPNNETIKHGNEQYILHLYLIIINHLLEINKNVYIFRHSNDLTICKKIYSLFKNNERVILIEDDMNCLEYLEFIKQFEFIIASRFHAIVHAYKAKIPAIVLGWAVKYKELANIFEQDYYVFNISENEDKIINNQIIDAIDTMNLNLYKESEKIRTKLDKLMLNSCLQECWKLLDK